MVFRLAHGSRRRMEHVHPAVANRKSPASLFVDGHELATDRFGDWRGAWYGKFSSPLVSGPTVADLEGNGKPLFVFEFADPAQQMAGDPSDGAVVWQCPAGLNPRGQPRGLNGLLRTSSGAILVTTDKALTAIDPRSGQIVWSAPGVPRGVLIGDWDGNGPNKFSSPSAASGCAASMKPDRSVGRYGWRMTSSRGR